MSCKCVKVLSHSLLLIHYSPGVCLITVNTAAGVNRRGTVSAVPVMEQDTLAPPATLVSMSVCACSCVSVSPPSLEHHCVLFLVHFV